MSLEASFNIKVIFPDEEKSKNFSIQLRKALKSHNQELASALDFLVYQKCQCENSYEDCSINVEDLTKKKNIVNIYAYSYTSEDPVWFIPSITSFGATQIHIRGDYDCQIRNFYFRDGKKVTKKKYVGEKPAKSLTQEDIEINKSLFLPKGRTTISATLTSTWELGDIYERSGLEFRTDNGEVFYHIGNGELINTVYMSKGYFDVGIVVRFTASFERGKLDGEFVSFAKRPSKISVVFEADKGKEFEILAKSVQQDLEEMEEL
jgi:hypothetical protein